MDRRGCVDRRPIGGMENGPARLCRSKANRGPIDVCTACPQTHIKPTAQVIGIGVLEEDKGVILHIHYFNLLILYEYIAPF